MNLETSKKWEGQIVEGRFPLHRFLGGTDASAVFLTDSGQYKPREAAIKLISADSRSAEQQISRWKRAGSLNHPHLIRLWDVGRCQLGGEKLLYVVMECADEDLSQILPQRPLASAEAGDMLRPALDVLAYLHGRGLAHGHLKPSNIMAIGDRLKISSDGICLVGEPALRGEPGPYDAPEVLQAGRTAAGDVWSLGMTLTETLLQRLPAWEQKDQDPVPPATLPAPFREIVRQCLRVDPSLRASLADILTRLDAPLAEVAAPAPAIVPPAPIVHRSRMWLRLAYGGAIVLAMLVAFFVGLRLFNPSSSADRSAPVAVETPAQEPAELPVAKPAPQENTKPPALAAHLPSHVPPAANAKPVESHPDADASGSLTAIRSSSPNASAAAPSNTPPSAGGSATSSPSAPTSAQAPAFPPNFTPGEVARQVLPLVPESARDTIRGTVRVRVRVEVDASGDVAAADLDTPGPSHYFANLAMDAARRWKFTPAKSSAQDVASAWMLRFDFSQIATKAFPSPVTP